MKRKIKVGRSAFVSDSLSFGIRLIFHSFTWVGENIFNLKVYQIIKNS